jgi:WD40 repeat protein
MNRVLSLVMIFLVWTSGLKICATEELQGVLTPHTLDVKSRLYDVSFSPDGRRMAVVAVEVAGRGKDSSEKKFREEVEIWEWESGKLDSHKLLYEAPYVRHTDYSGSGRFVRYSDGGSKLIVCQGDGHLLVMDSNTLEVVRDVDVEKRKWPSSYRASNEYPFVRDMEVDSHARRAAVLLAWGSFDGGELRVYDLSSGSLLQKWSVQTNTGFSPYGPISIDPEGNKVALSVEPFVAGERKLRSDERNVLVYEIDSGRPATAINTGYVTGTVRLTASNTLLTVSADDTHNNRDPMKIWDTQTGKLLNEIANPEEGIHHALEVSADGRVAVASIGLEEYKRAFLWLEAVSIHKNDRLRFWDLTTGKVIATTPFLHTEFAGAPHFRLSPDGNLVATYSVGSGSILLFEIKHLPTAEKP